MPDGPAKRVADIQAALRETPGLEGWLFYDFRHSDPLAYRVLLLDPAAVVVVQEEAARRGVLEPTGEMAPPGPAGGRPAMLYRFAVAALEITDPFAVLRPPGAPVAS